MGRRRSGLPGGTLASGRTRPLGPHPGRTRPVGSRVARRSMPWATRRWRATPTEHRSLRSRKWLSSRAGFSVARSPRIYSAATRSRPSSSRTGATPRSSAGTRPSSISAGGNSKGASHGSSGRLCTSPCWSGSKSGSGQHAMGVAIHHLSARRAAHHAGEADGVAIIPPPRAAPPGTAQALPSRRRARSACGPAAPASRNRVRCRAARTPRRCCPWISR